MKDFFNNIIQKPTIFSILGILSIIIGTSFTLYAITLKGGASLGALFSIALVISSLIFIAVDRILVEKADLKFVNIIELIILVLLSFFAYFSN
ncbi:hypothetical protein [Flavobacterium sp. KACC 22763]|uniref:hypothetical protein n=1 Tax=Flavobacterium sp. KACC 22763 TaxID=3025668 RepID=UPI002365F033|nr:hypothetical protein [Flavobacterium sp. KACC 22763]WDF64217.1 hypothetical protein PQ463_21675 [Flavobacterium sp. KACC 22763]